MLKKWSFEAGGDSPGEWFMKALFLRDAALRFDIYDEAHKFKEDQWPDLGFLGSVNLMLVAFSFEALLKAVMIMNGHRATERGVIANAFRDHDMDNLLRLADPNKTLLDREERKFLKNLQKSSWRGRYPIPTRERDIDYSPMGGDEHRLTETLWLKLRTHIIEKGWMIKGKDRMWMKDLSKPWSPKLLKA